LTRKQISDFNVCCHHLATSYHFKDEIKEKRSSKDKYINE